MTLFYGEMIEEETSRAELPEPTVKEPETPESEANRQRPQGPGPDAGLGTEINPVVDPSGAGEIPLEAPKDPANDAGHAEV